MKWTQGTSGMLHKRTCSSLLHVPNLKCNLHSIVMLCGRTQVILIVLESVAGCLLRRIVDVLGYPVIVCTLATSSTEQLLDAYWYSDCVRLLSALPFNSCSKCKVALSMEVQSKGQV